MRKKKINIVLCGSMKVKDKIIEISNELEKMGYNVLLPVECMQGLEKVIASRAHFDRISNPENDIILIVNVSKNGIDYTNKDVEGNVKTVIVALFTGFNSLILLPFFNKQIIKHVRSDLCW